MGREELREQMVTAATSVMDEHFILRTGGDPRSVVHEGRTVTAVHREAAGFIVDAVLALLVALTVT